ncbi:response regulator [Herbivorax sp. ANBcel31]|uniref:response regulator n=1 Tax=Herbivorax sp. ANBcel31 TaxID=3069754 RepID=UPI0027B6A98E|nr:response regulator [Herbivorax sp. ANBcel31]MDQ2085209.1 response regulator [Herbivorax sp. ANBcel31]
MNEEVIILIAEDDDGHAGLIRKNLVRSGVANQIIRFKDGQEIVDFLLCKGKKPHREPRKAYIILLDIRMPKLNGIEVLRIIKEDSVLKKIPVSMLTTTDEPKEIEKCHEIGCSNYITKPIEYEKFIKTIKQLGLFISIVKIPKLYKV